MSHLKAVTVLLVEDDEVDVQAVQRAFIKSKIANPIVVAKNGLEALQILRGEGQRQKLEHPYLVMLDLNMPLMNGLEFLEEIRSDSELQSSIIFVLTTSNAEEDRVAAYDKHVAGYILKSNAGEGFVNMVNLLDHYWKVVELPD